MRAAVARETISSFAPTSSSGRTAATVTGAEPNSSRPPAPNPRTSELIRPITPWPRARGTTTERPAGGGNGAYLVGATAEPSIEMASPPPGPSTTVPSGDRLRVIHTTSLATTTEREMPGTSRTASRKPAGRPPGVQARNVRGASGRRTGGDPGACPDPEPRCVDGVSSPGAGGICPELWSESVSQDRKSVV